MKDALVVGGGLAGLTTALLLAKAGLQVALVERKKYPFHKVCGEYISNEVVPFLQKEGIYPQELNPVPIRQFLLTDTSGNEATMPLDLGGFGISRYALDHYLLKKCIEAGVEICTGMAVEALEWQGTRFEARLRNQDTLHAALAIGTYGKRDRLDKHLGRPFIHDRSAYIGVKYHVEADLPEDVVALHNFPGGYCGVSAVENGRFNVCYLGSREDLRRYGSIEAMEKAKLWQNPYLRQLWQQATFLWDRPEVINEISFATKKPVEEHILMAGDTAGLITPLCGNGMAMAIHAAKLLAETVLAHYRSEGSWNRQALEKQYEAAWLGLFARRLWVGRTTQRLFGTPAASRLAVWLGNHSPALARQIMKRTHGQPF